MMVPFYSDRRNPFKTVPFQVFTWRIPDKTRPDSQKSLQGNRTAALRMIRA
jgi:hypothetical protein